MTQQTEESTSSLIESFISWYAREYAYLKVSVSPAEILRIEGEHLLILNYGYRYTLFRRIGEGFKQVYDAGTNQAGAWAELERRGDPSVYWTIPEKIQHFVDQELAGFIEYHYNRMKALARPWSLDSAIVRGRLTALETLTASEMEMAAAEFRQSVL